MLLGVIIDFVVDYLKCHQPSLIARCYVFFGLTLGEKVGCPFQCSVRECKGALIKKKTKISSYIR
jgi:hypothetical protein